MPDDVHGTGIEHLDDAHGGVGPGEVDAVAACVTAGAACESTGVAGHPLMLSKWVDGGHSPGGVCGISDLCPISPILLSSTWLIFAAFLLIPKLMLCAPFCSGSIPTFWEISFPKMGDISFFPFLKFNGGAHIYHRNTQIAKILNI